MSTQGVYSNTVAEFYPTVVDLATDATTVTTRKAIIRGVYINTTLTAYTCEIKDGSTTAFTIPAGSVAGTWIPLGDTTMNSGIVVDPDNSLTGNITVIWMLAK